MWHWKRNRLWLLVWAEVRIKDRLTWNLDWSDVSNIKIVSECRRHYLIIFIWFLSGKKRNSISQRVISIKIFLSFLVLLVSHDQHKIIAKIQDLVPIFFSYFLLFFFSYLHLFFSLLFSSLVIVGSKDSKADIVFDLGGIYVSPFFLSFLRI